MKKALIIRLSSLGDVVLSSVLIDPLIEAGYKPFLLTYKPYHQLFEDDGRLSVIATTKDKVLSQETISQLKREGFELFIDIHRNVKTLLLRLRLGGVWKTYRKESLRRRLATKFRRFRKPYYVTLSYLRALGELSRNASPLPKVLISEERLNRLRNLLPSENFVVLAPGARYPKKRYPYYGELARLLKAEGFEVVWVGDAKDRELVDKEPGINLCSKLSLPDVLGVIKLAKVFVGNDSGLLHCARAVRTPAVQIFGGTHPTLGFSLFPQEGRVILRGLECQPCDVHGKGGCRFGDFRCLEIDPQTVLEKTLSLVSV